MSDFEHSDASDESPLMRRLSQLLLQLGPVKATLVSTLLSMAGAMAITAVFIRLAGLTNMVISLLCAALCTLLIAPPISGLCFRLMFKLERARRRLSVLATQDPLTGIFNRRYFMQLAEREWARSRSFEPAPAPGGAVLLIDVDFFKRVNDRYGHLCGDAVLIEVTRVVGEALRPSDSLARYGGEELVVLLPGADEAIGLEVAERIRERVAQSRVMWVDQPVSVTVSIGMASYAPQARAVDGSYRSLDAVIDAADKALYQAKQQGRNRVQRAVVAEGALAANFDAARGSARRLPSASA